MATSNVRSRAARALLAASLLAAACAAPAAWSREAASTAACQAAANSPAIVAARSAIEADPGTLEGYFQLADAWSDAGCFGDAVRVLQDAEEGHAGNQELDTRLRVARSLVGEEHFFDNLDRATAEARLKRASFRCSTLYDLEGCTEALRLKPDDPPLLVAQGDALLRARRPADALSRYRLAAVVAPGQHDIAAKITAAESQLPPSAGGPGGSMTASSGTQAVGGAQGSGTTPPGVGTAVAGSTQPGVGAPAAGATGAAREATKRASDRREALAAGSADVPPSDDAPPLRTANAAPAGRRYSNAAPASQSH